MNHDVRYTTIQHEARIELGLSNNDYCVADSINHLSNNPDHRMCTKSTTQLGAFIGIKKRSTLDILKKLITQGLVEKLAEGSRHLGYRTTERWYEAIERHRRSSEQDKRVARFSTVNHIQRLKLELSVNDFCVGDSIYRLSSNPKHPTCTASQENIGAFIGLSRRSVNSITQKLMTVGLVEKISGDSGHLGFRATSVWYQEVVVFARDASGAESSHSAPSPLPPDDSKGGAESSQPVRNLLTSEKAVRILPTNGVDSSQQAVQDLPSNGVDSSHNKNNTNSNTDKHQQQSSILKELGISKNTQGFISSQYDEKLIGKMSGELRKVSKTQKIKNPSAWFKAMLEKAAKGEYEFQEGIGEKKKKLRKKERSAELEKEAEELQAQERKSRVDHWINTHADEYEVLLSEARAQLPAAMQRSSEQGRNALAKSTARVQVQGILDGVKPVPQVTVSAVNPSPPAQAIVFQRREVRGGRQRTLSEGQMSLLAA